ncbi:sigma-70 family RNA polymerase sigma factor [Bremerella sp. P1]|uniref:sigma-70 family RNA polymerase sigma factor n=1 Tax=Bremerella sp. P1 TaxID=3026424 RepID=UPI002368B70F|nr:sigma-70 family RNA polymerase sigma factor [Bremerella sp. P1]WDI41066.1 sigma-70 family RNA polymerase sigma factor [Bremerella sp. P1]
MNESGKFIQLLTTYQSRLYAYILSLVSDRNESDDILQQTNVVLWQNADRYEPGTNFAAWSFRIAYFQVLAYRTRSQREYLVFDNEALDKISRLACESDETFVERQRHLEQCIQKLSTNQRNAIEKRYRSGATLQAIATETAKSVNAVKQLLFRARENLALCVKKNLAENM